MGETVTNLLDYDINLGSEMQKRVCVLFVDGSQEV
jgi:hypothetical protein